MEYGLNTKAVIRWSPRERVLRLLRFTYNRPWGHGWCARQLSLALHPRLWMARRESDGWIMTVMGIRLHWKEAHGGHFV